MWVKVNLLNMLYDLMVNKPNAKQKKWSMFGDVNKPMILFQFGYMLTVYLHNLIYYFHEM